MATELPWGNGRAVAMTRTDMETVVKEVAKLVSEQTNAKTLEDLRQMVRMEADLAKAREEITRRDQEIVALRQRLAEFQSFVATLQAAPQFPVPVSAVPVNGAVPKQLDDIYGSYAG